MTGSAHLIMSSVLAVAIIIQSQTIAHLRRRVEDLEVREVLNQLSCISRTAKMVTKIRGWGR